MRLDDKSSYINFCMDVSLINPQRQNLTKYFLPNGAIFIIKGSEIGKGLYTRNTMPFIMLPDDSIDIDTANDLELASKYLKARHIIG